MAKNQTSFKKGNPGGGRKPLPADIRAARNMSYEDMCKTVIEVRNLSPADIKKMDLEKEPMGKRAILNAYIKLDYRGIKDYEDRLWGKAKENIDMSVDLGMSQELKEALDRARKAVLDSNN